MWSTRSAVTAMAAMGKMQISSGPFRWSGGRGFASASTQMPSSSSANHPFFQQNYSLSRRHVHVEQHDAASTKTNTNRRRRRSRPDPESTSKQKMVDKHSIPSYKEFVHRFTVLSLYRNFFKTLYRANVHNEQELKQQIRHEFKTHQHDQDPFNIQRALAEGKRRLEELHDFTGQNNSKYEQDVSSWINIQDEEDPRGRVGQGWPWQK